MTKKLSCAIYEDYTKQIKSTKWKNILNKWHSIIRNAILK